MWRMCWPAVTSLSNPVPHRHGSSVDRVVLLECSKCELLVFEQVQQRTTYVLLIHCNEWISHGEHLHHERCDPVTQREQKDYCKGTKAG